MIKRLQDFGLDALLVVAVLATVVAVWSFTSTSPVEVISAKPAERQADKSLVAERRPVAKPAPAPHALPAGSTEERRISATVRPKPAGRYALAGAPGQECDPVTLDMSLVQDGEGGRRAVVSSPDGEVLTALDIPIAAAAAPRPSHDWEVGLMYQPDRRGYGAVVARHLGGITIGAAALKPAARPAEGWLMVGMAF